MNKEIKPVTRTQSINRMTYMNKYVWECIVCGRRQIAEQKPEHCSCGSHGNMVLNGNLIVTK